MWSARRGGASDRERDPSLLPSTGSSLLLTLHAHIGDLLHVACQALLLFPAVPVDAYAHMCIPVRNTSHVDVEWAVHGLGEGLPFYVVVDATHAALPELLAVVAAGVGIMLASR